eukprot:7929621-Pyramimonas_sp.AAC.1
MPSLLSGTTVPTRSTARRSGPRSAQEGRTDPHRSPTAQPPLLRRDAWPPVAAARVQVRSATSRGCRTYKRSSSRGPRR